MGKIGWPQQKGRDGERTPMQWNTSANAGFSPAQPWLPVPASYKTHNVASELKDPNSVLMFYKRLLALRHKNAALLDGSYVPLNENDPNVISYLRRYKDDAVLVVINMSGQPQKTSFHLPGFARAKPTTLLTTVKSALAPDLNSMQLEPFEVYLGEVGK